MVESLPDRGIANKSRRNLFLGLLGGATLMFGVFKTKQAYAAMPVIDGAAIANLVQQLNEMKRQIEELKALKKTADDTLAGIGRTGSFPLPSSPWQSNTSSTLRGLLTDYTSFPLPKGANPNFATIAQAKDFFAAALFAPEQDKKQTNQTLKMGALQDITKSRDLTLKAAGLGGQALAAHAKSTVPALSTEAADIVTSSGNAADLRGQIAVTNRALAGILQEQGVHRSLLASLLDNISAENVRKIPLTWGMANLDESKKL